MFATLPIPVVFAHRGACAYAPENTLAAFGLALEQGATAIEFDVKLSSDGQVVVIHDQTVDRTTDGTGNVRALSLVALRGLDAGSWMAEKYRGEKIPTLDELFGRFGDRVLMNVELTNYASPFDGLVSKVARLVERHGLEQRVLFSSFFPHNLMKAARLLPSVARAQLIYPGASGAWQRLWGRLLPLQAEHPFLKDVTGSSIANAHARGRRVHAWTVNETGDMLRLKTLGADGIFSDDPLKALGIFGGS
jgi:glycerophosphoryl diester phosphodiesterase